MPLELRSYNWFNLEKQDCKHLISQIEVKIKENERGNFTFNVLPKSTCGLKPIFAPRFVCSTSIPLGWTEPLHLPTPICHWTVNSTGWSIRRYLLVCFPSLLWGYPQSYYIEQSKSLCLEILEARLHSQTWKHGKGSWAREARWSKDNVGASVLFGWSWGEHLDPHSNMNPKLKPGLAGGHPS